MTKMEIRSKIAALKKEKAGHDKIAKASQRDVDRANKASAKIADKIAELEAKRG